MSREVLTPKVIREINEAAEDYFKTQEEHDKAKSRLAKFLKKYGEEGTGNIIRRLGTANVNIEERRYLTTYFDVKKFYAALLEEHKSKLFPNLVKVDRKQVDKAVSVGSLTEELAETGRTVKESGRLIVERVE